MIGTAPSSFHHYQGPRYRCHYRFRRLCSLCRLFFFLLQVFGSIFFGLVGMLVRRVFSKRCFALSPGCSVPNFSWKDVLVAGRFITSRIGTVGLSISYSTKNPLTLSNIFFDASVAGKFLDFEK